jgi:hypothetical protein
LIEALVDRAGATDSVRAKIATPKVPSPEQRRSSGAMKKSAPARRHAPTNSAAQAGADGAKELVEIAGVLARSQRDIEAAIRSKDTSRMKMAMTAIARAERRGGEILAELKGQSLPISLADRKRWREAAARSPKAFEVKLRRDVAKAQARINGTGTDTAAAKPKRPRSPAKTLAPAKSSSRESHTKLSSWHQEPDGSLSRQLTSVAEDQVAAAPAGAA